MPDCMSFPDNIIDFIDDYSFEDSDHVYTNGSKLISSFRVKQAIEHYLLREQEAVKPTKQHIEKPKVDIWYCGECGNWIGKTFAYCPWCGKKVKWDG